MASITTGYNDWADLPTYDADLDINEFQVAHAGGSYQSPVLNVQNWASLGLVTSLQAGPAVNYEATYYSDVALSRLLALYNWNEDGAVGTTSAAFLPNLGPYVQVGAVGAGGVGFTQSLYVWRSQRLLPTTWVPQDPYLSNLGNISIGAGATSSTFPGFIWGGPVQVRWGTAGQPGTLNIQGLNDAGSYTAASDGISLAANSTGRFQIIVPATQLRVQIANNGAAAANFAYTMWPSATGSS